MGVVGAWQRFLDLMRMAEYGKKQDSYLSLELGTECLER
jgi:hypothetical protein